MTSPLLNQNNNINSLLLNSFNDNNQNIFFPNQNSIQNNILNKKKKKIL